MAAAKKKIVLAYSGGLDTSVAIKWLKDHYDADIITMTIDLGMVEMADIKKRALQIGAIKAITVDGKEDFVNQHVWPALRAGAIYEETYPLATALGRPLIARHLVEVALKEGAYAVAHGCTGKGNDQVRFDISTVALAPHLKVLAPIREWNMNREEEIEYAKKHKIPVQAKNRTFSTDENLFGRSIEAGPLEDPWNEPPEEAYLWTKSVKEAPEKPRYVVLGFEQGLPVSLDGAEMGGVELIQKLNTIAGEHGVGRIDHLENRLVGIKSREVYEAPAGVTLHAAHKALETMTLTKEQARLKQRMAIEYADAVYNGLWFTRFREDMDAFAQSTQRFVSGKVRVRLHKGVATVVGRESPYGLYQKHLSTYDKGDTFDQRASEGFITIYGIPVRVQSKVQPTKMPKTTTSKASKK